MFINDKLMHKSTALHQNTLKHNVRKNLFKLLFKNSLRYVTLLPAALTYPIILCGGGFPLPTAVRIQNCTASPCSVTRGTVIPYQIDFVPTEFSETLTMRADLTALGETIDFPIPAPIANVCNWLEGRSCPVSPDQGVLTKSSAIPLITDLHGGIPAQARMRIYNASGSPAVCAIINLRIY